MKPLISLIATVAIISTTCLGQEAIPKEKPKSRGPKPTLTPFHAMSKAVGFEIMHADKALFIEMESIWLNVTKQINPKLPKPVNIVQLTYGYKKSGVSCVYLAPKVGSLTAEQVIKPLVDSKILKDRQYFKDWCIKSVPNSRLLIMVSGTTPEVRDVMIKGLK